MVKNPIAWIPLNRLGGLLNYIMKDFKEIFLKYKNIISIGVLIFIIILSIVLIVVRSNKDETSDVIVQTPVEVTGTICIDAGHGGSDVGAISPDGSIFEKDDNLKLALKVKDYLEDMNLSVVMTREDDSTIELNERCRIANTQNVDIFVSLHRNSAEDTSARGVEIWVHNSKPTVDIALANNIIVALESVGIQENRGVEFGYRGDSNENYRVNKLTTMPSCLVETGFISNANDRELYATHLDDYAKAIADGIYKTLEDIADGSVDTSRGKAGQNR